MTHLKKNRKFLLMHIALKYYRGNAIFYFKSHVTTCYHVKKSICIDDIYKSQEHQTRDWNVCKCLQNSIIIDGNPPTGIISKI